MTVLVGHDTQTRALLQAARSGRMHHAWILAGTKGIGKAGVARALALRLLAEAAGPAIESDGLAVPDSHPIRRLIEAF